MNYFAVDYSKRLAVFDFPQDNKTLFLILITGKNFKDEISELF